MGHALQLSASEAALSARLLADIRAGREARPLAPAVVLVRSNLVALQLSRRLAREAGGHANVRFLTFIDLARRLAGPGTDLPAGGERVMWAALAAELPPASYFGPVKDKPGFAETFRATSEDVRQAGLGSWHADLNLGEKLTLFGKTFDRYRALLSQGGRAYRDEYDLFSAATARAAAFADTFGAPELFVFGFYDFNELQRRLLQVAGRAVRLRLYVPFGEAGEFRFVRATREWLAALGCDACVLPAARSGGVEAARCWYGGGDGPASAEGVKIISAPDEEAEAREIAREALRLSREHGIRLPEMAVLYRGDGTLAVLTEVFDRVWGRKEGPTGYYVAGGRPLAATRAGDGARRMLELAWRAQAGPRPFGRRDVVDLLETAPLKLEEVACIGAEFEPALWDDVSAAADVVSGREDWAERLARYAAACEQIPPQDRRHDAADVKTLAAFTEKLFADLERFPGEGPWYAFAALLTELIERYFDAGEETQAVVALVRGMVAYGDVVGGAVNFKVFVDTFVRRSGEVTLPVGRFERGGINLIEIDKARGLNFRAVFIPAAAEGVYPGRPLQDPVILDVERAEFNDRAAGRWRFHIRSERVEEEPLIFHLALGAANEFLRVSYHRLDAEGRERLPSHYLLRLAGALAGKKFGAEDFDRAASAYSWFRRVGATEPPAAGDAVAEAEYWAARACEVGAGQVAAYLAGTGGDWVAARDARASARAPFLTPFDGLVVSGEGSDFLKKRYGRKVVAVGASDLEVLAACPRKYFFERILGLTAWEEPEERLALSPATRGKVVHAVLRELYSPRLPSTLAAEELSAEVARLTEGALAALEAVGELPRPFVFEVERRLLSSRLAAFVREDLVSDEGWQPTYFELRFGRRPAPSDDAASTAKPFVLAFEGGAAEIHGRIDRVDLGGGRSRILDYKTGRRSRFVAHLDGGRQLQPPLYLMAYGELFGTDVASSLAGYCFPVEEGEKYKFVVSDKSPLDAGAVRRLVAGLLALARDGVFVAGRDGPGDGRNACRYCDFRVVCDAGPGYLGDEKRSSPPAARLAELREIK